jgi:hypothetical protein
MLALDHNPARAMQRVAREFDVRRDFSPKPLTADPFCAIMVLGTRQWCPEPVSGARQLALVTRLIADKTESL